MLTGARQLLTENGQVVANLSCKLLEHLLGWELITSPALKPQGCRREHHSRRALPSAGSDCLVRHDGACNDLMHRD